MIGPYANEDDGTELVRVRRTCYIPPPYVSAFLASNMSPRLAWTTVVQTIRANNQEDDCKALIDFIRVAITRSGEQCPSQLSTVAPVALVMDLDLHQFRRSTLEKDFPNLNQENVVQAQQ
mmetsp:Transcript_20959/g.24288  ORF Transcript_20959/g.24288 Transcript_20959/m.24288 type:complete len:120 (+) Transcript_20959:492-851(+)